MTGECLWTGRPGTLSRYTGTYYSYRPACHTASLIPEKIERVLVTVSPPGHERHFDELEVVKGGTPGSRLATTTILLTPEPAPGSKGGVYERCLTIRLRHKVV